MDTTTDKSLPFLTRSMLDFQFGSKLELVVSVRSNIIRTINIVGATKAGVFKYSITTQNIEDTIVSRFNMGDMPIWVSVVDANGTIEKGNVWVKVDLAVNNDNVFGLTAGYVYGIQTISYPMAKMLPADPTNGQLTIAQSTNPAAGAEWSITVPLGEMWEILAIRFSLVTAATVGNRVVHIIAQVAGQTAYELISNTTQIISQNKTYTAMAGFTANSSADDNDIIIPMSTGIFIPQGDILSSQTTNLAAGDDFGVATITIRKHLILHI